MKTTYLVNTVWKSSTKSDHDFSVVVVVVVVGTGPDALFDTHGTK